MIRCFVLDFNAFDRIRVPLAVEFHGVAIEFNRSMVLERAVKNRANVYLIMFLKI